MKNIFNHNFFKLHFITDYDKENLSNLNINNFYRGDKDCYLKKATLWNKDNLFKELNHSEISCALKHLEALNKSSRDNSEVSLIVEDDVLVASRFFKQKLNKILNDDTEWDLAFIGQGIGKNFILNKIKRKFVYKRSLFSVDHPSTNCAEAYLIKKDAAKKISKNFLPFDLPFDWELAYQLHELDLKVKWLYPPLFFQGSKSGSYKSELR